MSKSKDPKQKKQLSLKRDRRNVYGENPAASRKGIAKGNSDATWTGVGVSPKCFRS